MSAAVAASTRKPGVVKWAIGASIGSLLALALVAGLLITGDGDGVETADGRRAAPQFSLPGLADPSERVSLPKGKPTVLYFFASWCFPCREEVPVVEAAQKRYDDVAFVGVNHLDHRDDALAFLEKYGGPSLRAGHDPGGDVMLKYRLLGPPVTVFIDDRGDIVSTVHGQLDRETLDEHVGALVLQGSQD